MLWLTVLQAGTLKGKKAYCHFIYAEEELNEQLARLEGVFSASTQAMTMRK